MHSVYSLLMLIHYSRVPVKWYIYIIYLSEWYLFGGDLTCSGGGLPSFQTTSFANFQNLVAREFKIKNHFVQLPTAGSNNNQTLFSLAQDRPSI